MSLKPLVPDPPAPPSTDPELVADQRALFAIYDEFFRRVVGTDAASFAARGDFGAALRADADRITARAYDAYRWGGDALAGYYRVQGMRAFAAAQRLGGVKLVLGGGSAFLGSHYDAVRAVALYADTVLIPDPVLPWVEDPREHEAFRHLRLLQSLMWVLHLKPLVDADLPYPAVVVFPSYEKSLTRDDPATQAMTDALIADVVSRELSPYLGGRTFDGVDALLAFADAESPALLRAVDAAGLFMAPGAEGPEPLARGIARYREYVGTWRTKAAGSVYGAAPDARLVVAGLMERIEPQYHLLENADELRAQPLLALDAQWHYYTRIARAYEGKLADAGALKPETVAALRALNRPGLAWLGNVPPGALAELRRANENDAFRRALDAHLGALRAAPTDDLDRVAGEVARALASLIAAHQNEVRRIDEDFAVKHGRTLAASVVTAAALFVPALAPFTSVIAPSAAVPLAGKYLSNKLEERQLRARAARSLTGVLAAAKRVER